MASYTLTCMVLFIVFSSFGSAMVAYSEAARAPHATNNNVDKQSVQDQPPMPYYPYSGPGYPYSGPGYPYYGQPSLPYYRFPPFYPTGPYPYSPYQPTLPFPPPSTVDGAQATDVASKAHP